MSANKTRCFAIRRLSPFQGYLQVIEAGDGQASSSNGIDWRVQVRIQPPLEQWADMDRSGPRQQIILFGFWSSEGGFHRVPLPPMISSEQIELAARPILDELLCTTCNVPFPQIDRCELWMLDKAELSPLVLIAACRDPRQLPNIRKPEWQSTLLSDHSFTPTWIKDKAAQAGYTARDELNKLIRETAGQNPRAQWFWRQDDGSGKGIEGIHIDADMKNRTLAKEDFPELLLKTDWPDEPSQQLVNAYLEWQAPFLLTLPNLQAITRKRLEQQAFKQVFKVEGQHKLWPEVVDREKLKAVLIEAQMRRSNPSAGENN